MGRPPVHDADSLLDAAVRLVGEGGPRAVTVAAVARAAGGPSGSVYHRFAGRAGLTAALWLRTVGRFQEGFFAALEQEPAAGAAPAAARHVVAWSRANEAEARVLLYGAADFGEADWAAEDRAALDRLNGRLPVALRRLAGRLGDDGAQAVERLALATIDLPAATVRRHLRFGHGFPPYAEDLVESSAAALLVLETCL
jgi:AcrR family transcriptional regulator